MARIAGVDLPPNKRAQIGMTYIYGVGKSRATAILGQAGVDVDTKIREISEDDLNKIRAILDSEGVAAEVTDRVKTPTPFLKNEKRAVQPLAARENAPYRKRGGRFLETIERVGVFTQSG